MLKKAIKFYLHFAVILKMSQSQPHMPTLFIFYRESNAMLYSTHVQNIFHNCHESLRIRHMKKRHTHTLTHSEYRRVCNVHASTQLWYRYWKMWKYCDRYIRLCSLQCSSHPSLFLFKMQMKIIYFVELVFVYQCADSFTVGMYSMSSLSVLLIKCHQIKHILVNVKWFRVPFSAHTSHILHHIYTLWHVEVDFLAATESSKWEIILTSYTSSKMIYQMAVIFDPKLLQHFAVHGFSRSFHFLFNVGIEMYKLPRYF